MRPARYAEITREIRERKASVLLEVGTWNGDRAVEMVGAAIEASGRATYHGFDLFEDITPERSREEFNVKAPARFAEVLRRLEGWAMARGAGLATFKLIRGDSRISLPEFVRTHPDVKVDLAWIDGGHSVETIESDWESVRRVMRPGGVVLLDDYYTDLPKGTLDVWGSNRLVERISQNFWWKKKAGRPSERLCPIVLPVSDLVKGGGRVQIVRVEIPTSDDVVRGMA